MSDEKESGIHWSYWVIGAVALIWNGLGVANYLVQMNMDSFDVYREAERAIIEGRPAWATTAFATAVFGGTLGSVLLLLRKSTAFPLFCVSLLGVTATMLHTLQADAKFGVGEWLGIILMPLAFAAFLIWYSKYAGGKHWLR
jgi:hypothetical protein